MTTTSESVSNTRIFVNKVGTLYQDVLEKTAVVEKLEQDLKDAADLYAKYEVIAKYVESSKTYTGNIESNTQSVLETAQSNYDIAYQTLQSTLQSLKDTGNYEDYIQVEDGVYSLITTDDEDFDYTVFGDQEATVSDAVAVLESATDKLDKANAVYATIKAIAERIDDVLSESDQAIRDKIVDEINKEYVDADGTYLESVDSNSIADYEIQLQLEIIERCIKNYYAEVVRELNNARIALQKVTDEFEQMLADLGVDVDGAKADEWADNDSKEEKIKAMLNALKLAVDTLNESAKQVNVSVGEIFTNQESSAEEPTLDDEDYAATEAGDATVSSMKTDYVEEYNDTNLDGVDDSEAVEGTGFELEGVWYDSLEDYKAKNPWDANLDTYTARMELANSGMTTEEVEALRNS